MRDERKLLTEQAELWLQVLNRQRHDWLNHVQVLWGYLRLGRPEEGEQYLKRLTELALQESMIARINCPLLSVYFLTFNAIHQDLQLEVEVCNAVDLSALAIDTAELFQIVSGLVSSLQTHLVHEEFETASLLVSLTSDSQGIHFRFDLAGRLHASGHTEVETLVERAKLSAAVVTEWLKTESEWVLTLHFPCRT